MIIGIDFSINSTAITIKYSDTRYEYFSFVPNYEGKEHLKGFAVHNHLSEHVKICSYNKEGSSKDSIEDQRVKIRNADRLSQCIIDCLQPVLSKCTRINIEGFSYRSKGNSFIDLISYNSFLKSKLFTICGDIIYVIPPKSLKKAYTDNGNASKCDMLRHFLSNNSGDLVTKINELDFVTDGEFEIPKPIDDLVDSIALTDLG